MLEIHFVHGFLGSPDDWGFTIKAMNLPNSVKIVRHDLLSDFKEMKKGSDPFLSWSRFKHERWIDSLSKRFFVGYSLGGRLLLHLDPGDFQSLFLIASHPGLSRNRENRKIEDQKWAEKIKTLPWDLWVEKWNQRKIFIRDRIRPKRGEKGVLKKEMGEILKFWSLGWQQDRRDFIKQHWEKIYWIYGKNDLKFKNLKGVMEKLLPGNHIFEIPDSGHGVLFDNPQALGKKISEWFHKKAVFYI